MVDTVSKINAILQANGHRLTASRTAIVETLVNSEGHITADDLALRVREHAPNVGRMTVYRTLELLSQLGAVWPIYQGTGAAHYILMSSGSHHHLICNRCYVVIEFENCIADELSDQLSSQFNFQVSGHLLELRGLCADCHNSEQGAA